MTDIQIDVDGLVPHLFVQLLKDARACGAIADLQSLLEIPVASASLA